MSPVGERNSNLRVLIHGRRNRDISLQRRTPPLRQIVASVGAVTSIRRIYTMTCRTTKEILLEVCAGRKRQSQSRDDPVKHGDEPHRFHSLRH